MHACCEQLRRQLCGGWRLQAREAFLEGDDRLGCGTRLPALARGGARDGREDPTEFALQGLERFCEGYHEVARVDPLGAARLLDRLQDKLRNPGDAGDAELPGPLAQRLQPPVVMETQVLPESHTKWEAVGKEGGVLFRSEVSIAAEGDGLPLEWFTGRLFVNEQGVRFESGGSSTGGLQPTKEFCTGLLRWSAISDLRKHGGIPRAGARNHEVVLTCAEPPPKGLVLQLRLGTAAAAAWLEDTWWRAVAAPRGVESRSWFTLPEEAEIRAECGREEAEERPEAAAVCAEGAATSQEVVATDADMAKADMSVEDLAVKAFATPPKLREEAGAFFSICAQLPPAEAPVGGRPTFEGHLPGTSLAALRALFEADDWPLHRLLREALQAKDLACSGWGQAHVVPGTLVRRSRYTLPLPPKVPSAVAKFVGIGVAPRVTSLYRLRCSDEEVVCMQQSSSEGVPFSDHFRVDDVLVFRPHAEGGTAFAKFFQPVWVKPLPWSCRPIVKPFIENQALVDAHKAGQALLDILGEALVQEPVGAPP